MFNSDAAVAALLSRNNIRDWAELNPQQTGVLLQQTERDRQAANVALAGEALQQMGATDRVKREIDYNKWVAQELQKTRRRDNAVALLGGLGTTAGGRLGYTPRQMRTLGSGDLLASVNQGVAQAAMLGNPSQLYANFWAPIASQAAGVARSG